MLVVEAGIIGLFTAAACARVDIAPIRIADAARHDDMRPVSPSGGAGR